MILGLLLAACEAPVESPGPSVLVLVADGVEAERLADAEGAPRLWEAVAPHAAVVPDALVDGATTTGPSHAAMVTGVHEALANLPVDLERGAATYRPAHPTLFEAAGGGLVLANSAFLAQVTSSVHAGAPAGAEWRWVPDADDPDAPTQDDGQVLDAVKEAIRAGPPRVMVVNLHEADRAAHAGDESAHLAGIAAQDEGVAELWTWLQSAQAPYAADLLVVLTADHGRHVHDLDGGWHNHGDTCDGCRTIPLWLAGPGVRVGEADGAAVSLLDLAPTLAAHLGVELPFAEGLPLDALVDGQGPARTGVRDVALTADHEVEARFRDDPTARSEVVLDGEVVSTPGAFAAEGPVAVQGAALTAVCFRELVLDRAAATQPWAPRCRVQRDGAWEDIGFAVDQVDPWWRPALVVDGDALHVSWAHNPDFTLEDRLDVGIAVRSATWTPAAGWADDATVEALVPTGVARRGAVVAWAESADARTSRYLRRIRVTDGEHDTVVDLGAEEARAEAPTLGAVEGELRLGFLVHDGAAWTPWASTSADGGATWSAAVPLAAGDGVLLEPPPTWRGGALVWFEEADGDAHMCQGWIDAAATCVSVGAPRVRGAAVTPGGVEVIVDTGVGAWARTTLP